MNKFKVMMILFYSFIVSKPPRGGRFLAKIVGVITFIFVFLCLSNLISGLDISLLDLGGAAILAVALSACLLLMNHYANTHLNLDGSLKKKKHLSNKVVGS
ncbi:hypothetical protein [Xylella fastidiosa]|nr:hypothetical protein [Xylella fastidiosa]UIX81839.1 hypothetical protein LZ756_02915 [Xylella fastidiosa subsp. sandyi]